MSRLQWVPSTKCHWRGLTTEPPASSSVKSPHSTLANWSTTKRSSQLLVGVKWTNSFINLEPFSGIEANNSFLSLPCSKQVGTVWSHTYIRNLVTWIWKYGKFIGRNLVIWDLVYPFFSIRFPFVTDRQALDEYTKRTGEKVRKTLNVAEKLVTDKGWIRSDKV